MSEPSAEPMVKLRTERTHASRQDAEHEQGGEPTGHGMVDEIRDYLVDVVYHLGSHGSVSA